MTAQTHDEATASHRQRLVNATASRMRELILDSPPDTQIGSLPELAKQLGVGIATIQQAARILEHEGLLTVRRGPGGGYFGTRPDAAALERSVASYLRVRGSDAYEALEMMTLLDCELMPAAAASMDIALHERLRELQARIDLCCDGDVRLAFEKDLHDVLFKMVKRPLMELLAHVSLGYYRSGPIQPIFEGDEGLQAWRSWRHHVIAAILARDPELARFEAQRHRRALLTRVEKARKMSSQTASPSQSRASQCAHSRSGPN